ncbi:MULTISPECIES: SMI1/KNR4 family protein [unclassified Streptomyces]|uniref:SMI1/KNR4 family protein n=1 Tax=unclassified Streptomyces TaxID=2593676 RepID=UPI003868E1CB|nr:SMI1/KNR4 family protein [Streptomyces sp. NBC_00827]
MSQEPRIRRAWARITDWLSQNTPRHAEALNPGADRSMLDEAEQALATRIPEELRVWLLMNNGSTAKDVLEGRLCRPHQDSVFLPRGNVFLDLRRMVAAQRNLLAAGGDWRPEWIPFARHFDAAYGYFLDTGAGSGEAPVMYFAEAALPRLAFPCLADFLEATADALEDAGGIRALGNQVLFRPVTDAGVLEWKRAATAP